MKQTEPLIQLLQIKCLCGKPCSCNSNISVQELYNLIQVELNGIEEKIEKLRKRKKPYVDLLNQIKPYIKQNKLRGSELLKAKGESK